MMAHAYYSPLALTDIDSASAYIAEENPEAAFRFLQRVRESVDLLVEFPRLGPIYPHPDHPNLRAKLVKGFSKYIIFYTTDGTHIRVVRLLHGARDVPQVLYQ